MLRRRAVLAALAGGSVALAGCDCGLGGPTYSVELAIDGIQRLDDGWRTTVTATATFANMGDTNVGVRDLSVRAYGPEPSFLAETAVGSLLWDDVPDSNRNEDECNTTGFLERSVTFETDRPPYYVGPSTTNQETLEDVGRGRDFRSTQGFEYDGPADEWPPSSLDPADYRTVEVTTLPWPSPDDVAVGDTARLEAITFTVDPHCVDWGRSNPRFDADHELILDWERPVPESGPTRPLLEHVAIEHHEFHVRIALHEVPWIADPDCRLRSYSVSATRTTDVVDVSRAVVEHVDENGDLVERTIVDS